MEQIAKKHGVASRERQAEKAVEESMEMIVEEVGTYVRMKRKKRVMLKNKEDEEDVINAKKGRKVL